MSKSVGELKNRFLKEASRGFLNFVDLEFFIYEVKNMPELMDEFEKWQVEFNRPKGDLNDRKIEDDEKCSE